MNILATRGIQDRSLMHGIRSQKDKKRGGTGSETNLSVEHLSACTYRNSTAHSTWNLPAVPCFKISTVRHWSKDCFDLEPIYHISICACHPCAGAMLIFSVSFQLHQMSTNVLLQKIAYRNEMKIGLMSSGLRRLALFQDTTICVSLFWTWRWRWQVFRSAWINPCRVVHNCISAWCI